MWFGWEVVKGMTETPVVWVGDNVGGIITAGNIAGAGETVANLPNTITHMNKEKKKWKASKKENLSSVLFDLIDHCIILCVSQCGAL